MKNKIIIISIVSILAVLLTACGSSTTPEPTPDVAAVRTSAASTVEAKYTLTAAAFTPTSMPPPAETLVTEPEATATETQVSVAVVTNAEGTTIALCDKYAWDINTVDVNIPDNTAMSPGQDFTKTWLIKNIGNCTWGEGYKLILSYGEKMAGEAQPFTAAISPGDEVEVSVNFTAPELAGTYFSFWTIQNAKGIPFLGNDDKALYVQIVVQ